MRPATLALALLALAAPSHADDCGVSISASPNVIYSGQSAQVNAFAHFPATAHAFAHADLGIAASIPAWSNVSAGIIAGPTVQGISVGQAHNPFLGIFADPANPIRIWSGTYTPQTNAPLLLPITATPYTFSYYPSPLTVSTVPCQAAPQRTWLFVNPLTFKNVPIAPGVGTTVRMGGHGGDDLLIGGDTTYPILLGLLIPAIHKARIEPGGRPISICLGMHFGQPIDPGPITYTFTVNNTSPWELRPDWPLADEYEYTFYYRGQTTRLRFAAVNNRGLLLDRLPDTYSARTGDGAVGSADYAVWRNTFGQTATGTDPDGRPFIADEIEVRAIRYNSPDALTPEVHTIEIRGAGSGGGGAGKCHVHDISI